MDSYGRYPNSIKLDIERQKLERLFEQSRPLRYRKARLLLGLKQIGAFLLNLFMTGDEPRIWVDKSSTEKRWCAYDPITNRSISSASEEGLRVWLEQRYYQ